MKKGWKVFFNWKVVKWNIFELLFNYNLVLETVGSITKQSDDCPFF